jgi:hypothetical protein
MYTTWPTNLIIQIFSSALCSQTSWIYCILADWFFFIFLCILCKMCIKWIHIGLTMSVHLSVCVIQLENHRTEVHEIWYGSYAIVVYPRIVLFNLLQSIISTWQTNEWAGRQTNLWGVIDTSATCSSVIHWCMVIDLKKKNSQLYCSDSLYIVK